VNPGRLADLIVAVHVCYVAFVVVGLILILLGAWLRWAWVRNRWFRAAHLLAILIVAGEAVLDIPCPLTEWERQLREAAGEATSGETFVGRLLHGLIFYRLPTAVFTAAYVLFAAVTAATLWLVPPRYRSNPHGRHAGATPAPRKRHLS